MKSTVLSQLIKFSCFFCFPDTENIWWLADHEMCNNAMKQKIVSCFLDISDIITQVDYCSSECTTKYKIIHYTCRVYCTEIYLIFVDLFFMSQMVLYFLHSTAVLLIKFIAHASPVTEKTTIKNAVPGYATRDGHMTWSRNCHITNVPDCSKLQNKNIIKNKKYVTI